MQHHMEIDQAEGEKTDNADTRLLDNLRSLGLMRKPMDGIPDPQQAAITQRLIEMYQDRGLGPSYITGFLEAFKLAHDYVVRHGTIWIPSAVENETVSHETDAGGRLPSESQ